MSLSSQSLQRLVRSTAALQAKEFAQISLGASQIWSADAKVGARVRCVAGALWITQQGAARDHILRAGETFLVTGAGLLVVQAVGGAAAQLPFDAD